MDQANTLRRIVAHHKRAQQAQHPQPSGSPTPDAQPPTQREPDRKAGTATPRVIAITSGKGGVGKTNTVLNLSLALSRRQRRVMLLDADMGLANVDVLLGLTPRYTLEHVLSGQKDLSDVVLTGPLGLRILPSVVAIVSVRPGVLAGARLRRW